MTLTPADGPNEVRTGLSQREMVREMTKVMHELDSAPATSEQPVAAAQERIAA